MYNVRKAVKDLEMIEEYINKKTKDKYTLELGSDGVLCVTSNKEIFFFEINNYRNKHVLGEFIINKIKEVED